MHVGARPRAAGADRRAAWSPCGADRARRSSMLGRCFARREHALQDDRMAPGRVRAHQHDEIGAIEVLVAHRDHVLAERALVAGNRRGHAQPRVRVDVRRADVALHELVGDVVVLGQQLAGDVERHRLGTVLVDAVAERVGDGGDGRVPGTRARRAPADTAAGLRGPTVSPSALPFTHSLPRLAGCAGSPRTSTAPSLRGVASTPQPTPQ